MREKRLLRARGLCDVGSAFAGGKKFEEGVLKKEGVKSEESEIS